MKKIFIYIIMNFFLCIFINAQENDKAELRLVFAGDIMGHDTQISAAKKGATYNYDTCFSHLKPYLEKSDIAIANLEVTLAGPPFKGYPQFSSPDELITSVKKSGFNLLTTANNHSLDRKKQGLERTIAVLDSLEVIYTGTFKNKEQRDKYYPLIIEKNDIRLAILNYTYGTNGLKVESPNIVNYIDRNKIIADLQKAKSAEVDFVIVTIHWGLEYQRQENAQQQELAEFLIENGADAIIGSHPHVVQPVKKVKKGDREAIVVYSLGNFISNQRKRYTDGGILFEMILRKSEETIVSDYSYLPVWVYKAPAENDRKHFVLIPSNKNNTYYSSSLNMSQADIKTMKLFNDDTIEHLKEINIMEKRDCDIK